MLAPDSQGEAATLPRTERGDTMSVQIKNLTPHQITVAGYEIAPEGVPARCEEESIKRGFIPSAALGGEKRIPVVQKRFGAIHGLPDEQPGTIFIVSLVVAQEAWNRGRTDVFTPADPIRDAAGRIIGCASLGGNPGAVGREKDDVLIAPWEQA